MKALVLKEYRQFTLEEFPVPELKADDVLVRVRACGICGSDVHGMDGSSGRRIPPIVMGHEASGVIRLHRQLREGDILLADRAFCSFVHVALLMARNVFVCFRVFGRTNIKGNGR